MTVGLFFSVLNLRVGFFRVGFCHGTGRYSTYVFHNCSLNLNIPYKYLPTAIRLLELCIQFGPTTVLE
jgi:hypothetical protein